MVSVVAGVSDASRVDCLWRVGWRLRVVVIGSFGMFSRSAHGCPIGRVGVALN